jgi:lysophospholipase L1-like esterase
MMRRSVRLLFRWNLLWLALVLISAAGAHETGSEPHDHGDAPGGKRLPRVLILGDSISMGYTPHVRELLAGKAEVQRPDENCESTSRGLERLDAWLGDGPWDVIHFNFGLHDLKYVDERGQPTEVAKGKVNVPIEQYGNQLQQVVQRLRQTGAQLIWCSTTPVPAGTPTRKADAELEYNRVAQAVMRRILGEERVIHDLHAFVKTRQAELQQPANVHFTDEGSRALAGQVAESILKQIAGPQEPTEQARGIVFHDTNGNRQRDEGEQRLPGVKVSNGREIVATNEQGEYELPVTKDSILFVIKPRGFRSPNDDKQLPKFYYVHKPEGSPKSSFAGVVPTGELPASVDFPLYEQKEPEQFEALLFGDPQPRDQEEVDFIAHDVVENLVGTKASFGVTLGDITFDNLDLFEPLARTIAVLGIPWYNVIGNHDMNYDAKSDRHSDETFERVYGPSYYSFDYGTVHFLVLDDVEWLVDEAGEGSYQGGLGQRQMEFIRKDLSLIPADQLVVLMMHIPLLDVRDRHELFRLIEQRPFCMSISAHAHVHQHRFIKKADGWNGPEPHHHVVNVTVCGGWWSGMRDERRIPHAIMPDGAPNGYTVIRFDGHQYQMEFRAAGRDESYQMEIHVPEEVDPATAAHPDVVVNVFNGSEKTEVSYQVDDGAPVRMKQVKEVDPGFQQVFDAENRLQERLKAAGAPKSELWTALPKPGISQHLWRQSMDTGGLADGSHLLQVTARLHDGQTVTGRRLFRVRKKVEAATAP